MHLVGFIIRIYHDTRSPERQIQMCLKSIILKLVHFLFLFYELFISFFSSLALEASYMLTVSLPRLF